MPPAAAAIGAGIVGSVAGSAIQARGQRKAAESQERGAQRAIAAQQEAQANLEARLSPFEQAGQAALDPLQQLALQPAGLPGAEILQNPLIQAINEDVTRRTFAGQASQGALGGTETALALQRQIAPTALNLGLQLQQQRQQNLFNLANIGLGAATQTGVSGLQTAGQVGQAQQAAGAAQAAGQLGQSQAIAGGIGDIAGLGIFAAGGGFRQPAPQTLFRPTIQGGQAAGPFQQTGIF